MIGRSRTIALIAWGIASGGIAAAAPAIAANIERGAELAQRWCTGCHVTADPPAGTVQPGPPDFRAIARGGRTADHLRLFLTQPHGAMPDLALSRGEIDDLIAYIETLR